MGTFLRGILEIVVANDSSAWGVPVDSPLFSESAIHCHNVVVHR